jgi:DNA mismatch repair protein MutH
MLAPPETEIQLLQRAHALAGKTIACIAQEWGQDIPLTLDRAKGWVGQLIEKALGAHANNLDQPDFMNLGIELKTLPLTPLGQPRGSTFVCSAMIPNLETDFAHSRVWRKMAKILWIPVETHPAIGIAARRIGTPLLWTAPPLIKAQLQQDWEELIELITLGHFAALSAHKGKYLQIRPKAPNAKTFIQVMDNEGRMISTVPKGFYLRPCFTQLIIQQHFFSDEI